MDFLQTSIPLREQSVAQLCGGFPSRAPQFPDARRFFAEPIGMLGGAVEDGRGLERLDMAARACGSGIGKQPVQFLGIQGAESAHRIAGLIEKLQAVNAGNDDGGRQR